MTGGGKWVGLKVGEARMKLPGAGLAKERDCVPRTGADNRRKPKDADAIKLAATDSAPSGTQSRSSTWFAPTRRRHSPCPVNSRKFIVTIMA